MLIINNGYGKSGTTWIQRGLRYAFSFRAFDKGFQNPKLANASIDPEKILTFIERTDLSAADYYSKSHWAANYPIENGRLSQALLGFPNVAVINSIRNIGDSTVSWYHHKKRDGEQRDFPTWFWDEGVGFVHRFMTHHMSWAHTKTPPHLFSYEQLKRGPHAEFARFMAHLERPFNGTAEAFNHHMDFQVSKAETGSRHMRKGAVGDWQNHFTDEMIDHVEGQFAARSFFDKCSEYLDHHGVSPTEIRLIRRATSA